MVMEVAARETGSRAARSSGRAEMLLIDDLIEALAADRLEVTPHAADAIKDEGLQLPDVLKAVSRTTPYARNLSRNRKTAHLIVLPRIEERTFEIILAREIGREDMTMVTVTEHHEEHYRQRGRGILDVNGDWLFEFGANAGSREPLQHRLAS